MCSIATDTSSPTHHRDAVRRRHAWRLLLRPTNPVIPSRTVLYHVIADHLETFLASCEADPDATGLPAYVQREFYDYVQCGILAHGLLRLGCDTCQKELLLPFRCKRRGPRTSSRASSPGC